MASSSASVCSGSRRERADADAAEQPGDQQASGVLEQQKHHRTDHLDQHGDNGHPAPAQIVADVSGEVQPGHHPESVRGEDHRDHEGREVIALLVQRV